MAQGDTPITIVGNLVADPELRYINSGDAVANFRVASTPRRYDAASGNWVDGEPMFLTCNLWRKPGENLANSLHKGDRVIVTGKLRQRSYNDKNGDRRTIFEVEVDEVGPSLRFATVEVSRASRDSGGNFGGNSGGYGRNQGGYNGSGQSSSHGYGGKQASDDSDPWSSAPDSDFGDNTPAPF